MPIQSDDLGIFKSAVMADVPEGGGGLTGTAVVDGLSNDIFPDVSDDNRAGGAFHLRKVGGKVNTDDQDMLLGSGWLVLKPPTDPAVDVTMFETDGWFDERTEAVKLVESTMVKGPRLLCRIQDTHYAGVSLLQLYNVAPATSFPSAGDSIVARNPSGEEFKVRVLRVTYSTAVVFDVSGQYTVNLATCELGRPLPFDILGAPVARTPPSASTTATVFSTAPATGARFHGYKPLQTAVTLGAEPIREVQVSGGIFSQLVPASTVPTPVVDVYPLVQRPTISRTAATPLTISTTGVTLTDNTVLQLPTAVEPGSLSMSHGATAFTSNNAGQILQGTTVVGALDWTARTITMLGSAPNYGVATNAITYKPATVTGATSHSMAHVVTDANQSLALVAALEPPPAPGTLTLSYMAQGRWYDLAEDGTGKLAGSDSSYGAGTLSFVTGSVAASMGALPDIGSAVILTWGEADSARSATGLPTRARVTVTLPERHLPGTLTAAWSRGVTNYTASVSATGVVTGPAQFGLVELQPDDSEVFTFSPDTLPDGDVTFSYESLASVGGFSGGGGGSYTLTGAPLAPGSLHFKIVGNDPAASGGALARTFDAYSKGSEVFIGSTLIGTINNTTGALVLNGAATITQWRWVSVRFGRPQTGVYTGASYFTTEYVKRIEEMLVFTLDVAGVVAFNYQPAAGAAPETLPVAPAWVLDLAPPEGLDLVVTDTAFAWAGVLHFVRSGVVYRTWDQTTGAATAVGAASTDGTISLGIGAPGASNAATWYNAAHDARGALDILGGVFRIPVAPIQAGLFQLQAGADIASANSGGILSGDFLGEVDSLRGIVRWVVADLSPTLGDGTPIRADELTYNAVYLQYVPLDGDLLGVDTAGLPADGRVPIFRAGGHVVVHHTDTYTLPTPVVNGTAYPLGRNRVASVVLRDAVGTRLPGALYEVDRTAGTITVKPASDISTYALPLAAEHRVQDELQVLSADISGKLVLAGALSHNYPVPGSGVSSKLRQGDKFARVFGYADRTTWLTTWDATHAGTDIGTASFNSVDFPIGITNRGAITERWAATFVNTTQVRIVGEGVGQVLTAEPIAGLIEAINPQTSAPYFSIPAAGWGGGWSVGNVLLFETQAAGAPTWIARSVQPGGTEVLDDSATFAYIANVDTP